MFLDPMEVWVRSNHLISILLSCPAILFTIGLHLFNKHYRNGQPKVKTKDEQIKDMKSCIEGLQSDIEDHKETIADLAAESALEKLRWKQE